MDHAKSVIDEVDASVCQVVLVSFVREGAREWQTVAGIEEDKQVLTLVDEARDVYQRFGLGKGTTLQIW